MSVVTLPLVEPYRGLPILKEGLRPFFLLAALWGALALIVWLGALSGLWSIGGTFAPLDWHRHELLYGYAGAVVGGFLLTVVAKWTGRTPLSGAALGALVALWLAGRVAILLPGPPGPLAVAAIDLAYFATLIGWTGRELVLGGNRKNLGVLLVVALFALGNGVHHVESWRHGTGILGHRIGIATLLVLILVIAGRIVPAFTRNWLIRTGSDARPAAFGAVDAATIGVSAATLALWVADPGAWTPVPTGALATALACSAALNLWRLSRWHGHRTFADPMVAVMHVAYAFIPAGFAAMAFAAIAPARIPVSAAVHLWTAGAVPLMCLAVMTRAGLGHTGRPLVADRTIRGIYIALVLAVLVRAAAGFGLEYRLLLIVGGLAWVLAHALYVVRYARLFATAR